MHTRVTFYTTRGPLRVVRRESFETLEHAVDAIRGHAKKHGCTDVKQVPDDDPNAYRFTARTPGGRSGRNVAASQGWEPWELELERAEADYDAAAQTESELA